MSTSHLLAQAAGDPRTGFQNIYMLFVVGLGIVALFNLKNMKVLGGCVIAWVIGSMIAFASTATTSGIGNSFGRLVDWGFSQVA